MEKQDQISTPSDPTDEEIALCAYRIWLHEGCPVGHDKEHWLKAREQLVAAKAREKSMSTNPITGLMIPWKKVIWVWQSPPVA